MQNGTDARAIVVGSTGGIGAALVRDLSGRGFGVTGLARRPAWAGDIAVDLTDERSLEAAAEQLRARAPFDIILVATGLLHDGDLHPEKSVREVDPAHLLKSFAVNSVGPALAAKHLTPLLPKAERGIFAALSARVGSISDNRLGGWYGYRASKAALNMIIKTLAIELARSRPKAICVGLHPGTVDTQLSAPFQARVAAGRLFTPDHAAHQLIEVIDALTSGDSGQCFDWDGKPIAP
jgi:NAD(P)-dependent dehydrogenase (short-subunit alcohol dehydrogenase family)